MSTVSNLAERMVPLALDGEGTSPQKVTSLLCDIKECENSIRQLQIEWSQIQNLNNMLVTHTSNLDKVKVVLLDKLQQLHHRIEDSKHSDAVQELIRILELLKALETEDSDLQAGCERMHAAVQPEMLKLEKEILTSSGKECSIIDFDHSLAESSNKLFSAKRELAAKLRLNLSLKKQIDDAPAQTELIQYEHRFSELYAQIQEKHDQTRKHYATYNTLLEIKELMLKEASLLNSINSQFQDAMTSTTDRSKLVDSMEVVVKGTKQKLEKVQFSLVAEQKNLDSLKEKHATAIAEQRHFSSLLQAFQEECARNDKLRQLTSM